MNLLAKYGSPVMALLALLILVRCGKDSPTKPPQEPTPAKITVAESNESETAEGSVSATVEVSAQTSDSDRAALIALYNAMNGPNWTNNTKWLSEAPVGDWYGVTTNTEGRVTRVEMDNNNLIGSIPAEIGRLDMLENLSLRDNHLSGALPGELGQLKSLAHVYLTSNQLTGSTLSGIVGELTNLTELDLQNNQLTGSIPSKLGSHMAYLALNGNKFSGPIPPELGRLSALRVLGLRTNSLSGSIPPELGQLSNLTSLSLERNRLSGAIPADLGRLNKLIFLSLQNNPGLSGALPSTFTNLTSLNRLYIKDTGICAPANPEIEAWLSTIEDHDVTSNCAELDTEALTAFYNSTGGPDWGNKEHWLSEAPLNDWYGVTTDEIGRVAGLHLPGNNLRGALPQEIVDLTNLKSLNLSGNEGLVGPLPLKLRALSMESLNLEGTGLCAEKDSGFQDWLSGVPNRSVSDCAGLDKDALVALVGLYTATDGKRWTNNENWLSQAPLATWYGVRAAVDGRISELDLSDNNLRGSLPSSLGKLAGLKKISLEGNPGLLGPLPESLTGLSIESLDLEGTGLCAPSTSDYLTWLNGIGDASGVETCSDVHPDWEALVTFYNETNGPNWKDNANWLSAEPLDEWFGVSTDANGRVTRLDLGDNNLLGPLPAALGDLEKLEYLLLSKNELSGPIPLELGKLESLRELDLIFCSMSGSIPPELGRLTNLEELVMGWNGVTLTGTLPAELGKLANLRFLNLAGNGFHGPIPEEMGQMRKLETLYLDHNNLTGSIPRELGQLANLDNLGLTGNALSGPIPREFWRLTRLRVVNLSRNRLTGRLPGEIGALTNMVRMLLGSNQIAGSIPGELSRMTSLEWLDLSNNRLSGAVPPELGTTPALKELTLAGNTELVGPLPIELTQLNLETLMLGDTGLCAPIDAEFQHWLRFVQNSRVASCAVPLEATAYLTQVSQSLDHPVPLVAGEDALLRVFLKAGEDIEVPMPPVRASFYRGGGVVYVADAPGEASDVPASIEEETLTAAANIRVPGSVIIPSMEVVVEIDPGRTLDPALGIIRRIPETGRIALDVRELPTFDVTMVPFLWVDGPDHSVLSVIDGLTPESDLMRPTRDLLPVNDFQLTVHPPVWTSVDPVSDNYSDLAPELKAIYALEGESGYYMGIFRLVGPSGGLAGVALGIPSTLSFSILDPNTIAHEFGHNLNLFHAPCGGAGGPDPFYPYDDGSIGVTGYDMMNESLVSPRTWDLMSYCDPKWISDYSFTRALTHRMALGTVIPPSFTAAAKGLLLWGGLDEHGGLTLEPAFVVNAPPRLPDTDGPYTITGMSDNGVNLFSLSFAMSEYADADGGSFAFVVPVRADWPVSLDRITLTGPEGFAELDEESDRHYALMRDSATGEVRGILRDWNDPSDPSPAGRRIAPEPGMEITASGGIPDQDSW